MQNLEIAPCWALADYTPVYSHLRPLLCLSRQRYWSVQLPSVFWSALRHGRRLPAHLLPNDCYLYSEGTHASSLRPLLSRILSQVFSRCLSLLGHSRRNTNAPFSRLSHLCGELWIYDKRDEQDQKDANRIHIIIVVWSGTCLEEMGRENVAIETGRGG